MDQLLTNTTTWLQSKKSTLDAGSWCLEVVCSFCKFQLLLSKPIRMTVGDGIFFDTYNCKQEYMSPLFRQFGSSNIDVIHFE